jgi:hypothetical protein
VEAPELPTGARLKRIFDWGLFNLCLIPTIYVARHGKSWWIYAVWLRGRIGFYHFEPGRTKFRCGALD